MIQVDGIFVQQGGGGPVVPDFTYTGDYRIVNEGTPDWKIYFTSSGIFTPASNIAVQVQAIGGGSGGAGGSYTRNGGGGGQTSSVVEELLEGGVEYEIIIGSGGAGGNTTENGNSGGNTEAFGLVAFGGICNYPVNVFEFNESSGIRQSGEGGDGGSGGQKGSNGQNAGDINPDIGGGIGGVINQNGGDGNFGSKGGQSIGGGGGGGGGGYGGGGGGGGYNSPGGAGAPGVIIMRNTRLSA